jgi:hypothetical protein
MEELNYLNIAEYVDNYTDADYYDEVEDLVDYNDE